MKNVCYSFLASATSTWTSFKHFSTATLCNFLSNPMPISLPLCSPSFSCAPNDSSQLHISDFLVPPPSSAAASVVIVASLWQPMVFTQIIFFEDKCSLRRVQSCWTNQVAELRRSEYLYIVFWTTASYSCFHSCPAPLMLLPYPAELQNSNVFPFCPSEGSNFFPISCSRLSIPVL